MIRTAALAGLAVAAVVALAMLGPWRSSEAIGPDINNDGYVDLPNDILGVIMAYQQEIPLAHKLHVLAEDVVMNQNETFTSDYVDTRGCNTYTVTLRFSASPVPPENIQMLVSMDGITADRQSGGFEANYLSTKNARFGPPSATGASFPYVAITQLNNSGVQQTIDGFLYCYP